MLTVDSTSWVAARAGLRDVPWSVVIAQDELGTIDMFEQLADGTLAKPGAGPADVGTFCAFLSMLIETFA